MRIVQFRKKQDKEAKHICLGLQIPSNASNHEVVDRGDVVDIPQSLLGLQDCTSIDLIMKWDSVKEKLNSKDGIVYIGDKTMLTKSCPGVFFDIYSNFFGRKPKMNKNISNK